ncbi:acyl-CoA carboxylase subunit epsilon [Nonomuraea rubra]|uniref:acyl-CoA carboxylase subunit epsilon n=1 Tax=Nonomuraea rubra TaxID=46180 RepID=UPI00161B380E|nr:acyl-CoA carboxylase subunit epsilon [Nonomuraea rubra]
MKIVKGSPTAEELAALVVALRAVRRAPAPLPVARRVLRRPVVPGPGGWRESRWSVGGRL